MVQLRSILALPGREHIEQWIVFGQLGLCHIKVAVLQVGQKVERGLLRAVCRRLLEPGSAGRQRQAQDQGQGSQPSELT